MDVSGISTSINASNNFSSSTATTTPDRVREEKAVAESRHEHAHNHRSKRAHGVSRGHSLDVFKQELKTRLMARFSAKFVASQPVYDAIKQTDSSDDVANTALGNAKQVAVEAPVHAARSIISFRAAVHDTAEFVRETLGKQQDYADMDAAVAKVSDGLTALEDDAARNVESATSVTAVDTRSKQRSTIQIRTQEGDIVKLSLRRADNMSATDSVRTADGKTTSTTEVEVSSRTRLMLRVDGDLNDSELAAIQNVFAQAEQIANDFFGGDLGAAFSAAEGFEFDSEQLSRVKMRFGMRQVTNISHSETVRIAPAVTPATPEKSAPVAHLPADLPAVAVDLNGEDAPAPVDHGAALKVVPVDAGVTEAAEPAVSESIGSFALSSFFDTLSTFLRSFDEGFSSDSGNGSLKYYHSESFKLNLLKAVVHTVAPDDSDKVVENAGAAIDVFFHKD